MLDCNTSVTVWNMRKNADAEEFVRHVLPVKCKWKSYLRRNSAGYVDDRSQNFVVIVPFSPLYRPPEVWLKLTSQEQQEFFTLADGDLLATGVITEDITGVSPHTKSEVRNRLQPNAIVIKSFMNNTGCAYGKHIRVEGN